MQTRKPAPVKLDVRMPADLRTRLDEDADRNHRSTNQQAVFYIRRGMEAEAGREEALSRIEAKVDRILELLEKR